MGWSMLRSAWRWSAARRQDIDQRQLQRVLLQTLETERCSRELYEVAIECALDDRLRDEWHHGLRESHRRVQLVEGLLRTCRVNEATDRSGGAIARCIGDGVLAALRVAIAQTSGVETQITAADCVALTESRGRVMWEVLGDVTQGADGPEKSSLQAAVNEARREHGGRAARWRRELWNDALGLPAVLPPPGLRRPTGVRRSRRSADEPTPRRLKAVGSHEVTE